MGQKKPRVTDAEFRVIEDPRPNPWRDYSPWVREEPKPIPPDAPWWRRIRISERGWIVIMIGLLAASSAFKH